uniref:Protein kinase domain-containing protein n=1 Tax=Oryza meridionalis TaxID=40149 RepID=A0A0E0C029_9ORYZ
MAGRVRCSPAVALALVVAAAAAAAATAKLYSPADRILVNCGSTTDGLDAEGRRWVADATNDTWLTDSGKSSIMAAADELETMLPSSIPYMTARVFTMDTVYNFTVNPRDRHWIRLHFYPSSYNGLEPQDFRFSVFTTTGYMLLHNFSVYFTTKALTQAYLITEYSLPRVPEGHFGVTFSPSPMMNVTYAFVNGIEVISMPDMFNDPATMVGFADQTADVSAAAFQTMYRLNVGGAYIPPSNDSGLTRPWYDDTPFVQGPLRGLVYNAGPHFHIKYPSDAAEYAAPPEVYLGGRSMGRDQRLNQNSNLTWSLHVECNFTYVVRLHFCELQLIHGNQRVFDIYINNRTAQTDVDVLEMATERGVPVYKDYAVRLSNDTADEHLWVAVHPSVMLRPQFYDAILNGLEVFKVNNTGGSLASPDPVPYKLLAEKELGWGGPPEFSTDNPANMASVMGGTAGGAAAAGIVAAICVVVYSNKRSKKLRHRHLVSLIGFCEEDGEMVLVYDYMEHGTLREHLYHNGGKPTLSWRHRLDICIGAARGLHYLHTGAKYTIIHRDVKTTNILVDDNWVAKVSDFGLSKSGPTTLNQSHVSTVVKGSFGYLDPEYYRRQQLTDKSDVYSFGVVLFEVLMARPALDPALPRDQVSLADYALACKRGGALPDVVDPAIRDQIAPECLAKFADTAEKCLSENGTERPTMGDVLWNLESAMHFQDAFDAAAGRPVPALDAAAGSSSHLDDGSTASVNTLATSSTSHPHEPCVDVVLEPDDVVAERATFSQLVQPTGR